MELWDAEMSRFEGPLEDVSARDRFGIAVDVLGWSMATTECPIEDADLAA